jgi:hypothetical protein
MINESSEGTALRRPPTESFPRQYVAKGLIFFLSLSCVAFALVEIIGGGSTYNFVSTDYFFQGSVYVFGAWWSVILIMVSLNRYSFTKTDKDES